MTLSFSSVLKPLAAGVIVLATLSAPHAQISGSSTGWCSDYEGNNFPCGSPPSSSGGGGGDYGGGYDFSGLDFGGGCATAGGSQPQTQASAPVISPQQVTRQKVDALYEKGRGYYNQAEDMAAANAFYEALQLDPSDQEVRFALGSSLFNCGMDAAERADRLSQLVYHERAVKLVPDDRAFKYRYEEALKVAPAKTCSTCTKALESDVVHGLRMSQMIFQYVHQATVNYKNCTRRLNCADNDGSHFYYLARKSCLQTFQNSEDGFRSCLEQALEDRGYYYYWPRR